MAGHYQPNRLFTYAGRLLYDSVSSAERRQYLTLMLSLKRGKPHITYPLTGYKAQAVKPPQRRTPGPKFVLAIQRNFESLLETKAAPHSGIDFRRDLITLSGSPITPSSPSVVSISETKAIHRTITDNF